MSSLIDVNNILNGLDIFYMSELLKGTNYQFNPKLFVKLNL